MKRRIPKPENLAKLTPDQLEIYKNWEREIEQSEVILQGLLSALASNNLDEVRRLSNQLKELVPPNCEHGRSVYLSCQACDQIERTLFPESFNADGERIDNMDGECILDNPDPSLN